MMGIMLFGQLLSTLVQSIFSTFICMKYPNFERTLDVIEFRSAYQRVPLRCVATFFSHQAYHLSFSHVINFVFRRIFSTLSIDVGLFFRLASA